MIYSSILVTFGYAREYEKGKQVISNIVSEDCRKNKRCINSIFESELKKSTNIFLLGVIDKIEIYLPAIINELKLDIQRDLDVKL
jgi:hypothetical protein|tara:strand:+ start:250 stop:504 length:255 start_codon:yes stop_codon:yes gene_type:complete